MNIRALILTFSVLLLTACDAKDNIHQPKTQSRSMIIGGMPVHDQDYKLMVEQVHINSVPAKPLNSID